MYFKTLFILLLLVNVRVYNATMFFYVLFIKKVNPWKQYSLRCSYERVLGKYVANLQEKTHAEV